MSESMRMSNSILVSYAVEIPVILLVQQIPMISMLMIPKTMAYVTIVFIAYNDINCSPELVAVPMETGD